VLERVVTHILSCARRVSADVAAAAGDNWIDNLRDATHGEMAVNEDNFKVSIESTR